MFNDITANTVFTDDVIEEVKGIRYVTGYETCDCFLATMRAILPPNTDLEIRFQNDVYAGGLEKTFKNVLEEVLPGTLLITYLNDSEFGKTATVDGWERIQKVTDYYRGSLTTICYINKEIKSTVYFLNDNKFAGEFFSAMKIVQSIPITMPWFFPTKESITETILKLLKSTDDNSCVTYLSILKEIADEKYDYTKSSIKKRLDGFDNIAIEQVIKQNETFLTNERNEVDRLYANIATHMQVMQATTINLNGLKKELEESSGGNKTLEFFLNSNDIDFVKTYPETGEVVFIVRTYATLWDEAEERYVDDRRWAFYLDWNRENEALARAIFKNKTVKVRMCAAFSLGMKTYGQGGRPALSRYNFDKSYDTYMPNPHLQGFSCMNAWKNDIGEALLKNDMPYAIEICRAATETLNLSDTTVMDYMATEIKNNPDKKVFELPTREIVDYKGAVKFALESQGE